MTREKSLLFIFIVCSFGILTPVFASEMENVYYTNKNGVSFEKEDYDFISELYFEGYQNYITIDDYKNIVNFKLPHNRIESVLSTEISGTKKKLKISKICTTNCLVSVVATWTKNPVIRSYDVIGAIFEKTSLITVPKTKVLNSNTFLYSSEIKEFSNGFGTSIKLLNGNDIVVIQEYRVEKGGTVYASYQHATSNISLENSKNYVLSRDGFGGVFKFKGIASQVYDKMQGVSIKV